VTTQWLNRIVDHGEEDPTQLLAHPDNFRVHPKVQQDALRDAIQRVGLVQQVVVNRTTGHVLDGHLRVELAISESQPLVPVSYVDVSEDEEAIILATLDPIAAMAGIDKDKLAALVAGMDDEDAALARVVNGLAAGPRAGLTDPDDVPEPRETDIQRGDLFELGDHRLLCGDSTKAEDVSTVLAGETPFLCVTDPPYGVQYDPKWRNEAAAKGQLAYAGRRVGEVTNDDRADWRETWALTPSDVIYSWHPPGATSLVHAAALQDSGFVLRMQIIWAKSNFPIGRGDYHVRHEPCWYAVRKGRASRRTDDRTQTTLWQINLDKNVAGGHSTQKPVECMRKPIENHEPCDVYEPFCGSGTTIVAAEQLGRRCIAIEIEPSYCQVIIDRWEAFTGKTAVKIQG